MAAATTTDPLVPAMESMAEGTTPAESDPAVPRSLPDEILIWEILARLPPKPLVRCRAVCQKWRRVTSTRDFLLAHHARQPTLLLICDHRPSGIVDIIPFDDHRADQLQLQAVAQLDNTAAFSLEASCDGLLILYYEKRRFSVCNPTTRQYAPLPPFLEEEDDDDDDDGDYTILGMYAHGPTGEYRLLVDLMHRRRREHVFNQDGFCVITLGSPANQLPRKIICPEGFQHIGAPPVLFRGSLHWYTGQTITAFDTAAESFRQMRSPIAATCNVDMFETAGMLGMSVFHERAVTLDMWMMEDYQGETWAFKHKIEFPSAELTLQFGDFRFDWSVVVPSSSSGGGGGGGQHAVSVLAKFGDSLIQLDVHGKMVATFHGETLSLTPFLLQQSLVSHTFFPTLEGYVLNASPFI